MQTTHFVLAAVLALGAGQIQAQQPSLPTAASSAAVPPAASAPDPAAAHDVPIGKSAPGTTDVPSHPAAADAHTAVAAAVQQNALQPSKHWYTSDPEAYSIVSAGHGLSLHKPMYVFPLSYSQDFEGRRMEVLFALSLKQQLFDIPLYFGYSQKSFFDAYDSRDSKPFRETDYNPELFYRWIPRDRDRWHHLGIDFGAEHESNGQSLPDSRSWNRLYIAPFQAAGSHLVYWKWWWRLPENKDLPRTDPNRDDNPDIQDYYGYSELHFEQQLFGSHHHLAHAMFRFNPITGRGAFNLEYSIPSHDDSFFWGFYLWQGYGESLIDYNRSITRVGIGIMLAR